MNGLEIIFKSGATVSVDAVDLKTRRDRLTGELTSIEWTTPDRAKRKLFHIDCTQIAALVVLR